MLKYVHPEVVRVVIHAVVKPFKFKDALMEKGSIDPTNV
jgi:hypothetical protein